MAIEPIPALLVEFAWLAQKAVYLETVNDCVIYQVQDGWARAVLEQTSKITCVENALAFEAALQDAQVTGIYVFSTAALTPEIVRRIIKRHAFGKTIFWEVKTEQL